MFSQKTINLVFIEVSRPIDERRHQMHYARFGKRGCFGSSELVSVGQLCLQAHQVAHSTAELGLHSTDVRALARSHHAGSAANSGAHAAGVARHFTHHVIVKAAIGISSSLLFLSGCGQDVDVTIERSLNGFDLS